MPEVRGLELEYMFDCGVCGWVGIRTMSEIRGLLLECFLLVLGGWAGDPDDARKTWFVIGVFFVVLGGWAGHPGDARARGFGTGSFS